jgi:hypothetical protein
MDLVELRMLAVGGLLAVGIVMSVLGVAASVAAEWIRRASHARDLHASGGRVVGRRADLRAGRVRC